MDPQFASIFHQRACATLLAYTAKTFLPILQPIKGDAHPWGFHYDFLCSSDVDSVVLTLLTEEMRRNVRKDLEFQMLTMVPNNAKDFLKKSQPVQAALVGDVEANVVDLVKIDSFYDISEETIASSRELQDFALLHIEKKQGFYESLGTVDIVRIHGTVATDKKMLKAFVKEFEAALKQKMPTSVTVKNGFATWYPEGLLFHDAVIDRWKALCQKEAIMRLSSPLHATKRTHIDLLMQSKTLPARSGEWMKVETPTLPQEWTGLFQTNECIQDVIFRLVEQEMFEQELISSLQFIQELLSIYRLDTTFALVQSRAKKMQPIQERLEASTKQHCPVFESSTEKNAKPRIEVRAIDARKRQWLVAFVEIELVDTSDLLLFTQRTVFSLERLLALHLDGGYKKA